MTKSQMKMSSTSHDDTVRTNGGWQFLKRPDPKTESTVQFYNGQGKQPKNPVLIANNRKQNLEKEQWNDKIFTGDSIEFTADITRAAVMRDQSKRTNVGKGLDDRMSRALGYKFT